MSRKKKPNPSVARAIDADIRNLTEVRRQRDRWEKEEEKLRKKLTRYAKRYGVPDSATALLLNGKKESCTVSLQESRTVDAAMYTSLTPLWYWRLVRRVRSVALTDRLNELLDDREAFRALPRRVQKAIERFVTRTPFTKVYLKGEK